MDKLTSSEVNTLIQLVTEKIRDGSYLGDKEVYYRRLKSILSKLKELDI